MNFTLEFSKTSLKDIESHKKSGDKSTIKKIEKLLNEISTHPATGTGQPEQLKHDLVGLYSRRINKKHRLVYRIDEITNTVNILSVGTHYHDK